MFKKNLNHLQNDLFSFFDSLPKNTQKEIQQTPEYHFYHLIFRKIPEEFFAGLYSKEKSRPNAPVNCMMASLILKERKQWSYEQLFENIKFNLLTKIALGLNQIGEIPFCPASIFNFQNRLNEHFVTTGENLFEKVLDALTDEQLKKLKLKTNIQRCDSTLASSNVRNYSRLQLLIEMIIRIYRVLSKTEQHCFKDQFAPYVKDSSGQYIYKLKSADLPHELEKVGQMYHWIYQNLFSKYSEVIVFQTFERVYTEHFTVVEEKVTVKASDELSSRCLQSPDDLDATYRNKNGRQSKGQTIHVSETAHQDNQLNLITDVSVRPNNEDDSHILQQRLEKMKQKTPDLDELHQDGGYGSTTNDEKCEQLGIQAIQTAVKGIQSAVPIEIEQISDGCYQVRCPLQTAKSTPTRTRYKAVYDLAICRQCPHQAVCPANVMKKNRIFYFSHADFLSKKRQSAIRKIPKERRCLRNNVEATMREFTCKMPQKKLRVRGAFKAVIFAYSVAISVNFGRIYRYIKANPDELKRYFNDIGSFLVKILKKRFSFFMSQKQSYKKLFKYNIASYIALEKN